MKPVLHPGLLLPTSGPKKISHQEPRHCDSSVVSGNQLLATLSNGLKDKTLLAMLVWALLRAASATAARLACRLSTFGLCRNHKLPHRLRFTFVPQY